MYVFFRGEVAHTPTCNEGEPLWYTRAVDWAQRTLSAMMLTVSHGIRYAQSTSIATQRIHVPISTARRRAIAEERPS